MASSIRSCQINECKRSCRAMCLCCQQYLCLNHLNEHENLINSQIPLLTDQINSLSDQFNNNIEFEVSCFNDLNQWRENAHQTVEQFYQRKYEQYQEFIQMKRGKQKKEFNEMKINFNKLIQEQEATKEEIDSMKESIQFIEKDISELQHFHSIINPLIIDENLITIPIENHGTVHSKRTVIFPERSSAKSMKLSRWEVEKQSKGITDSMRINILNTISMLIDTHGPLKMEYISKDMKNWLNESYGKHWNVEIIDKNQYQYSHTIYPIEYLQVKETKLDWIIGIFKENV
ncbi:hypothetical protein I4U23_016914 [Adineta vaga]|nr:hypothetical protein I4U23_016914 [Adineta vaga]